MTAQRPGEDEDEDVRDEEEGDERLAGGGDPRGAARDGAPERQRGAHEQGLEARNDDEVEEDDESEVQDVEVVAGNADPRRELHDAEDDPENQESRHGVVREGHARTASRARALASPRRRVNSPARAPRSPRGHSEGTASGSPATAATRVNGSGTKSPDQAPGTTIRCRAAAATGVIGRPEVRAQTRTPCVASPAGPSGPPTGTAPAESEASSRRTSARRARAPPRRLAPRTARQPIPSATAVAKSPSRPGAISTVTSRS